MVVAGAVLIKVFVWGRTAGELVEAPGWAGLVPAKMPGCCVGVDTVGLEVVPEVVLGGDQEPGGGGCSVWAGTGAGSETRGCPGCCTCG